MVPVQLLVLSISLRIMVSNKSWFWRKAQASSRGFVNEFHFILRFSESGKSDGKVNAKSLKSSNDAMDVQNCFGFDEEEEDMEAEITDD